MEKASFRFSCRTRFNFFWFGAPRGKENQVPQTNHKAPAIAKPKPTRGEDVRRVSFPLGAPNQNKVSRRRQEKRSGAFSPSPEMKKPACAGLSLTQCLYKSEEVTLFFSLEDEWVANSCWHSIWCFREKNFINYVLDTTSHLRA